MKIISKVVFAIALVGCMPLYGQSAILNGGFETGDFTDWSTQSAATGSNLSVSSTLPKNGTYSADFAGTGGQFDYVAQSFSTVVGQTYKVTFQVASTATAGQAGVEFTANLGGTLSDQSSGTSKGGADDYITGGKTLDFVFTNKANNGTYHPVTVSFTAKSTSTSINFGAFNNLGHVYLDNVSLQQTSVPEPSQWGLLLFLGVAGFLGIRRYRSGVSTPSQA